MTREEAIEMLDICIAHMKRISQIFDDMFKQLEDKENKAS